MANNRHTMFFMGKEYPNVAMGGGSGGGGKIDVLYSAETTTPPQTITLEKALTNYDYIVTHIKSSVSGRATIGYIYTVESMATGDIIGGELAAGSGWIWYTYTSANLLTYLGVNNNYYITEITGLKIGAGGGGSGSREINYSTEEQEIGTWIDGRPIYQITLGTNTSTPLGNSIDVSALDIDFLIWSNGIGSDQNPMGNTVWSLNSVSASQNRLIYLNPKTTLKREGSFYLYFITLQYVKNADLQ